MVLCLTSQEPIWVLCFPESRKAYSLAGKTNKKTNEVLWQRSREEESRKKTAIPEGRATGDWISVGSEGDGCNGGREKDEPPGEE